MLEQLTRWHRSLNARWFAPGAYLRDYGAEVERTPGDRRVHIGCGDGTTLARYATVPAATIALDISHDSLRQNPGALRVVGDAAKLPFTGASVDLVHCEHVLEHLADPAAVMAEVSRVLRPGMVFTIEPGLYSPELGGFRHSDMVVVKEGGIEIMTFYPRDLESMIIPV